MRTSNVSGLKLRTPAGGNTRRAGFRISAYQRHDDLALPIREDLRHARARLLGIRIFRVIRG